jgi:glycosyltransferase involved in cell wall biosynthesis
MRHVPALLGGDPPGSAPEIPLEDELRFLYNRFGAKWTRWAVFRSAWSGRRPARESLAILGRLRRTPRPAPPPPYREGSPAGVAPPKPRGAVTVLIPTVDRYPYLDTLLDQLRRQTVRPLEIVIVDQTPLDRRRPDLAERFPDLPIRLLHLDQAGQCSSRNAGIAKAEGEFLIFLDDDDEVPPDLIEKHLAALERFGNDVSCGVADEDGTGPLPEAFRRLRASDVFPTNNSLIRTSALSGSGLFDLAYERGARADADIGMRLYLAGELMVLNPEIRVLHRHAPSGGLRTHGARVITYASSRARLLHRHLPTVTEIYKARRYFSPRQVEEQFWISALGTFSSRGSRLRRIAKAGFALLLLPHSLWTMRKRGKVVDAMLREYPRIPAYSPSRRAVGSV